MEEDDAKIRETRPKVSSMSALHNRDSIITTSSNLVHRPHRKHGRDSIMVDDEAYNEYLMAMKRVYRQTGNKEKDIEPAPVVMSARERRRLETLEDVHSSVFGRRATVQNYDTVRTSIFVSMVPDEIVYKHADQSVRIYETALMFVDVSGFTDICEYYTKTGLGPSGLSQVLNSYIGDMVQEILTHDGDVLKFSGDAFLSMWKTTDTLTMQDIVHTAIDCALIIQKNYGTFATDVGVVLKVKVAIAAGQTYFSIIGDQDTPQSHYVIIGQPVWDVKTAEHHSTAGDVITSASAWMYVNESEYCTQPFGDGIHTKVLGVGATWKKVDMLRTSTAPGINEEVLLLETKIVQPYMDIIANYREFSLRPAVVKAIKNNWGAPLRRFMVKPVLLAADNDEPMDFLTEVRHVVIIFINVITATVTDITLMNIVIAAYKCVCSISSSYGGMVNKVSMFDKDMMFLVVFGLRGLKHEDEAEIALISAARVKENIRDPNIMSISIGITSGITYCGVVGHALRREYTVIGSAVNKAARLMMAYPNKITCDKETFLRSNLNQENFQLMPFKALKGIGKPGPIYEFNDIRYNKRFGLRHPLLGRNDELRKFKITLDNAIKHHEEKFTRYKDFKYGFAVLGVTGIGKTRFVDECLIDAPRNIPVQKINLVARKKVIYFEKPFGIIQLIMLKSLGTEGYVERYSYENKIRISIDTQSMRPIDIYAINTVFGCRFSTEEKMQSFGNFLSDSSVKRTIQDIFKNNFPKFWLLVIEEAQHIDDESWRVLLFILELKSVFIIFTITDDSLSINADICLSNNMIVKVHLGGIDRWYHAALACQILDVQAIPTDLEKVIQSASNGVPGWILNFVISLVQRGDLTVVTITRGRALDSGAVLPSTALLERGEYDAKNSMNYTSNLKENLPNSPNSQDEIQMAVLKETYIFDMTIDMTMDAIILKTYDSLTPFEKKLLKCSSVLGDVFSRRMLLHLMQCDSNRMVAIAVAKLFKIFVLECEGGDFTHCSSVVLIHPAPAMVGNKRPYCACLGTRPSPDCRDLPMYAFCGYMKFHHPLFRTTTYDLLTISQKQEMHARSLLFLERYTRRCNVCGSGCFTKLLGCKCEDGLINESEKISQVRKKVCALNAESRDCFLSDSKDSETAETSMKDTTSRGTKHSLSEELESIRIQSWAQDGKRTMRSFSSLKAGICECMPILLAVYCQVIEHCRAAGETDKLVEAYLEYADTCLLGLNLPQAIRLLSDLENVVQNSDGMFTRDGWCRSKWLKDFYLGRIHSLRGACLMEAGDHDEAQTQLLKALEVFHIPFPTSKLNSRINDIGEQLKLAMAVYVSPNLYVANYSGIVGQFYEEIADTLNKLFKLYTDTKQQSKASLAAKMSLNYALKTDSNFRLLCVSYGNMVSTCRVKQKFSWCLKLEKLSMEVCHRKIGQLDVSEVQAVCYLYTSLFLFYVEFGKKQESLEFGLSVMHMMTTLTDLTTRQLLVLFMLKLLLTEVRIHDMVTIMREFFYMTEHYDYSSETWYHYFSIVILLDTGYCVENYSKCEKFYMKRGDAIIRSKTPEAAWNFFVIMWLVIDGQFSGKIYWARGIKAVNVKMVEILCNRTIRIACWERTVMWEDKIERILTMKFEKGNFYIMLLIRLVEGYLIKLAREMDNKDLKNIINIIKLVKSMFRDIKRISKTIKIYSPRYYLLYGYYHYIIGKKTIAFKYLDKAHDIAKKSSAYGMIVWTEHTKKHWKGELDPRVANYWVQQVDAGGLLDYHQYDIKNRMNIVPYTLPLPKD